MEHQHCIQIFLFENQIDRSLDKTNDVFTDFLWAKISCKYKLRQGGFQIYTQSLASDWLILKERRFDSPSVPASWHQFETPSQYRYLSQTRGLEWLVTERLLLYEIQLVMIFYLLNSWVTVRNFIMQFFYIFRKYDFTFEPD